MQRHSTGLAAIVFLAGLTAGQPLNEAAFSLRFPAGISLSQRARLDAAHQYNVPLNSRRDFGAVQTFVLSPAAGF